MTKKEIDAVLLMGNGHTIPNYPNGPTKFQMFRAIKKFLKGKLYWYALREVHISSDNRFSYKAEIKEAFQSKEPQRNTLMNKKEQKYLEELPEKITIYRGMTEGEYYDGDFGISWSLKKEIAEFFAYSYRRNYDTEHLKKVVHELVISKSEVVAFLERRSEFEIIYLHQRGKEKE